MSWYPSLNSRLSEKTIELNFCAQLQPRLGTRIVWIGLTQAQEHEFGFDATTWGMYPTYFFQFKASNYVTSRGRRFQAAHAQMTRLIALGRGSPRSVFYVLPEIGSHGDLAHVGGDVVRSCWLLDASELPDPMPPPTLARYPSQLRQNRSHYIYLNAPTATIRSEPVTVEVRLASPDLLSESAGVRDSGRLAPLADEPDWGQRDRYELSRYRRWSSAGTWAVAVLVPEI